MPASVDDEALMEEVRGGSAQAFEALYDRHHRAVFNFFLRFLGDRRAAQDLLQETFLRVFAQREAYRPTASFTTWLFTIARNLLIDRGRLARTRPEALGDEPLREVVDPSPDPLAVLEGRSLEERLQAAVERLPPFQREVVLLSRFAGLSHDEIAHVTGASPGAVRVALHRGLRRLRDFLGPV
jgi:RNA polymerase sigma-70 factor (ECF subfamily)